MAIWNFPSNNYGEIKGFNESGIATFSHRVYGSLAREICQNSLDAGLNGEKVKIEFKKFYLKTNNFPDYDNFYNSIKKCLHQSKLYEKDREPQEFFQDAINLLKQSKIPFLRISDFNTTGLRGSDKDYNTDWINLVKATGSSDKSSQSGGSFGIGKSAPFACSSFRTIFYTTLDNQGLEASQGVAKLISFNLDNGTKSQGTGFYGESNKNDPIYNCISYDSDFKRTSSGTDIYIAGFIEDDTWKETIIEEILNNYFYAIYKKTLEIIVDDELINDQTLGNIIKKYCPDDRIVHPTKEYYQVLTSPETNQFTEDFKGMGLVKLLLLRSNNEASIRKVAMIRKPWMKIKDYRPGNPAPFAGVFIVEGNDLNSFLRKLENPAHDNWEYGRAKTKGEQRAARSIVNGITKFIRDKLSSFFIDNSEDPEDLIGADQFLQLEDEDENQNQEDLDKDFLAPRVTNLTTKIVKPITSRNAKGYEGDYKKLEQSEGKLIDGENLGVGGEDDGGSGDRVNPGEDPKEFDDDDKKMVVNPIFITPLYTRLICINKALGIYRIIFETNVTADECQLSIYQLDEQGAKFPLVIEEAKLNTQNLKIKNNKVLFSKIQKDELYKIDFKVNAKSYFSAEVRINGFKK